MVRYYPAGASDYTLGVWGAYGSGWSATIDNKFTSDFNQGHTHSISTTSTSTGTVGKGTTSDGHTHTFTGTATTLNNLQPYITVYMYRRTK